MPGIQSRGRTRNNTNKIEQVKTQNKVIATQPRSTKYTPRPSSGKLDQSTQNKIQPTESNIIQAVRAEKVKHMVKPRTSDDPASKIMLGMGNTGSDYANILNSEYEDKSILNQAIGHAIEGKWDKAGQIIQENPYRFTGNLLVEAGSALIPIGGILKAAKVAKVAGKVLKNVKKAIPKKKIDGEEVMTLYNVVEKKSGKSMWYSEIPNLFYHDKIIAGGSKNLAGNLVKDGTPQIRSVEVPKSVYEKFRVSEILKTANTPDGKSFPGSNFIGPINKNAIYYQALNPKFIGPIQHTRTFANTPREFIASLRQFNPKSLFTHNVPNSKQMDPNAIGEHSTSEFFTKITSKNAPDLLQNPNRQGIIDAHEHTMKEKIATTLRLQSANETEEWALKKRWQNTAKVVATMGQKESFFKRVLNPNLSTDKYANELANIYKKKNLKLSDFDAMTSSPMNRYNSKNEPLNHSFQYARQVISNAEKPIPYNNFNMAKLAIASPVILSKSDKVANIKSAGGYGQFL
jgi:hypothetical protein